MVQVMLIMVTNGAGHGAEMGTNLIEVLVTDIRGDDRNTGSADHDTSGGEHATGADHGTGGVHGASRGSGFRGQWLKLFATCR